MAEKIESQAAAARKFVKAHGPSRAVVENIGRAGARVVLVGADGALGDVVVPSPESGEALVEAVENLDAVQRRTAELDVGSHCFRTIIDDLKKVNAAVRLAVYRASDEENVIQPFDVDGSTDIETGGDSLRDSIQGDVHRARVVGYRANAADVGPRRQGEPA